MSAEVSENMGEVYEEPKKSNRWSSWLIIAAFGLPMVMAYLVYSTGFGVPTGTINKGDLLLPATSMTDLIITDDHGQRLNFLEGKKEWRWLIVGDNECSQACKDNLYLTRQVHIRLGEKAVRLQRLYLNTDANYLPAFAEELSKEHPRLVMAHVNGDDWKQLLHETNAAQIPLNGAAVYVVDQEGFVMMTYKATHQGSDLLDDIKRLLKYSYED